ncbi:hypothetical protein DL96DRAFT_1815531 [Flagelloscypha sp. PMI_526]|nr:hypothetical protein DL96DRAFT_1815531 [Flagelloscypha sp. PMI_526]
MKRGAEVQLTRDADEHGGEDDAPGVGIQKADLGTLSRRPMRGLPKRSTGAGADPVPATNGFGTSVTPSSSSSSFGGGFSGFGSHAPSQAANILSHIVSNAEAKTASVTSPSTTVLENFYSDVRSLNVAFEEEFRRRNQIDACADNTVLVTEYKRHMDSLKKTKDEGLAAISKDSSSSTLTTSIFGKTSVEPPKTNGTDVSSFKAPPSTSSFSFGNTTNSPSTLSSSGGFKFNNPASTDSKDSTLGGSTSGGFTFAKPDAAEPSSKPTSLFGSGQPSTSPTFALSSSESAKSAFPPVPTSLFGSTSTSGDSKPAASTITPKPLFGGSSGSSGFNFGTSGAGSTSPFAAPSTTQSSIFGTSGSSTPTGSLGNKVGFSFGSPLPTPSSTPPVKSDDSAEGSSTNPAPTSAAIGGPNPYDVEGEGEQDEETVHQVKSKVLILSTDKDGKQGWNELGTGFLRIKRHKETGVRRLLLRNSTTGKINVNFLLYKGIAPTAKAKAVTIRGHDEHGEARTFTFKVNSAESATSLREKIIEEAKARS